MNGGRDEKGLPPGWNNVHEPGVIEIFLDTDDHCLPIYTDPDDI